MKRLLTFAACAALLTACSPQKPAEPASLATQLRQVDLISAIGKLPDELLVVLNPRRFLTIVEQNLTRAT